MALHDSLAAMDSRILAFAAAFGAVLLIGLLTAGVRRLRLGRPLSFPGLPSFGIGSWIRGLGQRVRAGIARAVGAVRNAVARVASLVKRVVIGIVFRITGRSSDTVRTRLIWIGIFGSMGVVAASLYLILEKNLGTGGSSMFLINLLDDFIVNLWFVLAVTLVGVYALVFRRRHLEAKATAARTRFMVQTVKRLSGEIRTPLDTNRVIATDHLGVAELETRIGQALDGERNDHPADMVTEGDDASADVGEREGDPGPGPDDGPEPVEPRPDRPRDPLVINRDPRAGEIEPVDDVDVEAYDEAKAESPSTTTREENTEEDVDEPAGGVIPPDEEADTDKDNLSLGTIIEAARMDLGATVNVDELIWRWFRPFIVVLAIGLIVLRLWTSPVAFIALVAGSALVASIYYRGYKWRKRRRLRSLQKEPTTYDWDVCTALVKTVDVPEGTFYMGWMAGRRYASTDRERFCRAVAKRQHQRVTGQRVAPSILEKFARNLDQRHPSVKKFERNDPQDGRPAIIEDLKQAVRDAEDPDGIVPKRHLAEMVVDYGGRIGHDPDLIAEEYAEIVPSAIAETEIEIEDSDGTPHKMTACYLRDQGLPSDVAEARAIFSDEFDPENDPVFPLPDVEAGRPVSEFGPSPADSADLPQPSAQA